MILNCQIIILNIYIMNMKKYIQFSIQQYTYNKLFQPYILRKQIQIQQMQAESITQKQQYLREKIIDKGYDAEDFVQYCTEKHSLSDLSDWSMQKLKEIVLIYVSIKTSQSKQANKDTEDDQWNSYEEGSNQNTNVQHSIPTQHKKTNHQNHHQHQNSTKTGNLVFSQADWGVFLGGASTQMMGNQKDKISNEQKKTDHKIEKPKKGQNIKQSSNKSSLSQSQYNKKAQKLQQKHLQNLEKQNPLSPPSKQHKTQSPNISALISQSANKNQNRGPINLTNVKLTTTKIKPMPKLPQINDIIITKTQQISKGFLQGDYTLYHIHFTPGNHTIQRKFTDFRKLRSILQNMYPHIRLPYLQPQGWLTSSQGKDTQTLAKYKWMLLDFLKHVVLRNQQIKYCPLIRKFCGFSTSAKSQKQYEQVSKQDLKKVFQFYQHLPRPKTIGQLCLSNNCIVIPPSNDGQKSMNNTLTVMQEISHEYDKLGKKFDTLFYNYEILAKSMTDVCASFEILQNLIKKYNFQNNQSRQLRIYEGMREVCTKMQNTMNEQYVVLKTRLKSILRYEKDNMMTLKQLFESKSKIHYEYAKQGFPILSKNSQNGGGQIEIQSSIQLQQPIRTNKNSLCVQQIFWVYFVKNQTRLYWQQLRKKINEQLTMISYEQLDNQNDNLNFWNSMIKKCVV